MPFPGARVAVLIGALALSCTSVAACTSSGGGSAGESTTTTVGQPQGAAPTSTTEPLLGAPTPTFEPLSDAFAYGDAPELDALWDACAAGEGKACDDLYHAAPVDSEYEQFGYTCGDRPQIIICAELDEEPAPLTTTTG